jgi:heat shock protein 1/8
VTFEIDANGILHMSACDTSTRKHTRITVTLDKGRLSATDIGRMMNDVARYQQEDYETQTTWHATFAFALDIDA